MGRRAKSIFVTVVVLAAVLVAPAYGASEVVDPGESIQEAIEAARPGDTIIVRPGTYAESLEIRTEGIRLLGSGAVLTPPQQAPQTFCNEDEFVVGMCIVGEANEETFETGRLLPNVTVDGFTMQGFGMGVFAAATRNLTVSHNYFRDNLAYGAFALSSTGAQFLYNSAQDSGFAAYYIGDSPEANATVRGNRAEGSDIGLFFRAARGARVVDNVFSGNCAGVLASSDPTQAGDLTLARNEIFHNDRLCEPEGGHDEGHDGQEGNEEYQQAPEEEQPEEEEPSISGAGIILFGTRNVNVRGNNVWGNEPSGQADLAGGIVVMTDPFTDALPSDITVTRNRSFENKPADLVWDRTGTEIRFLGNRCVSSQPMGLCGGGGSG